MDQVEEKGKTWLSRMEQLRPYKRHISLGLLGLLLVIGGAYFDKPVLTKSPSENVPVATTQPRSVEEQLESKLANLLSQVKGAGSVSVQVTLETGPAQDFAKNVTHETKTIQEKDAGGGVRTTTENKEVQQVLMGKENGLDKPVMVKEVKPVIKGVMVIAEGASDSTVKANLTRAVETGLGLPAHKVTVLPQRK